MPEKVATLQQKRSAEYRQGVFVLIVLAALTLLEFYLAVQLPSITILFVVALIKAAIIVQYYMHISHVFSEEEDH